jgi:hypothetical protein
MKLNSFIILSLFSIVLLSGVFGKEGNLLNKLKAKGDMTPRKSLDKNTPAISRSDATVKVIKPEHIPEEAKAVVTEDEKEIAKEAAHVHPSEAPV